MLKYFDVRQSKYFQYLHGQLSLSDKSRAEFYKRHFTRDSRPAPQNALNLTLRNSFRMGLTGEVFWSYEGI